MMHKTPLLDRGYPRRMWLADACAEFARFAIGTSAVLSLLATAFALLADTTLFIPFAIASAGVLLITPLGMCGITLAWRLLLGMKYSARLRPGDFRFAGIFCVVLVWASAALGEYALHFPAGHAIVSATTWPLVIGALMAGSGIQGRGRNRLQDCRV